MKNRMRSAVGLMAAALMMCSACASSKTEEPSGLRCVVAGYSHAGNIKTANPADLPYMKYPTRVYCFGISPDAEGRWYVNPQREQAQAVVRAAMTPDQEAFLVIGGGATAGNMFRMGTHPDLRAAYAKALVDYAHAKGFDGIDVDWETDWSVTPFVHVEPADMVDLLKLIRARMAELPKDTKLKQVSAALSSNKNGQAMGGAIKDYVDQICVMVYDTYGTREEGLPHAPMRIVKESLAGYAANGVPNAQILLGVPFYGGDRRQSPAVTQPYNTLCAMAGGAITPETNSYDGYAFNGVALMEEKTQYVLDNGYAGLAIWELSHDVDYHSPLSLLHAIVRTAQQ